MTCLHGGAQVHRHLSSLPFSFGDEYHRYALQKMLLLPLRAILLPNFAVQQLPFAVSNLGPEAGYRDTRFHSLSKEMVAQHLQTPGPPNSTYLPVHYSNCLAIPPLITSSTETALFNKPTVDQEVYRCDRSLVNLHVRLAFLIGKCTYVASLAVNHSAVPKRPVSGHEEPLVYNAISQILNSTTFNYLCIGRR
jgi:hypothetical protein